MILLFIRAGKKEEAENVNVDQTLTMHDFLVILSGWRQTNLDPVLILFSYCTALVNHNIYDYDITGMVSLIFFLCFLPFVY